MRMTASSVVFNGAGELLLIQRSDIRTFDVPGGGIEAGELPNEAAVRETAEETGLQVRPSHLLAIYYWPTKPQPYLSFYFRCELIGGTIRPSSETPSVIFAPPTRLPRRMLPFHRQRLRHCLHHQGQLVQMTQPVTLGRRIGKRLLEIYWYRTKRWLKRQGKEIWPAPTHWRMGAFTIICNEVGAVLWVKRTDRNLWNLPGGGAESGETPWETAVRETFEETGCQVRLDDLTSINSYQNEANLTFNYTAHIVSGQLTTGPEAADFAWFLPGAEPANSVPQHRERVADACTFNSEVIFRQQDGRLPLA
ncbi:MAG: NUDIX domain-containing protein [Anaerolineales bacterium]|nr:NUDIX domain-containing protein [Anaerolineales bacterium]